MTNRNYTEPKDFFNEMLKCLNNNEISDELTRIFMLLAEKFCNHSQWVRYRHIREDLISEGVLSCIRAYDKFSPYNKLGILIINGLLHRDSDDVFTYTYKGVKYQFEHSELFTNENVGVTTSHSDNLTDMFNALKDSESKIEWDGEMIEYDYKTCYNPHAFFTMVISNQLKQFIKKEYNQKNIVNKMCIMHNIDPDFGYTDMMSEQEKADNDG